MSDKLRVVVFGATGRTGSVIVDELLKSSKFDVIAVTRPGSTEKPILSEFQSRGAVIKAVNFPYNNDGSIEEVVNGADVVISAINWLELQNQKSIVDAIAKNHGTTRFIPCDFGTACIRGIRAMHDEKLGIHDYILSKGINYTFIDVGWWFEITLPVLGESDSNNPIIEWSKYFYGKGDVKTAVTDRRDIGPLVSRVIADPRTLNRYVFCWAEETTQQQAFDLAERVSGSSIPRKKVSEEDIKELIKQVPGWFEYQYSLWFRGDNVAENAKKPEYGGALDSKELYPDLKLRTLEAWAYEVYGKK